MNISEIQPINNKNYVVSIVISGLNIILEVTSEVENEDLHTQFFDLKAIFCEQSLIESGMCIQWCRLFEISGIALGSEENDSLSSATE